MRIYLLLGVLCLMLSVACAKKSAVCLDFAENGHGDIQISAGPWGEVGKVNMSGPSSYKRIPKDFTFDPCGGTPQP